MHQHGSKYFAHISKVSFSEHGHAADQIKGNDECTTCKHIFCPYTHARPLGWDQRSKHLSESSHVAYQINWNRGY